jgi:hypothetical protein
MKQVTYTDGKGKKYEVNIPDNVPDSEASKGIVIGPPDLQLDLPPELDVRLHNQLHSRGILTLSDALKSRQNLYNALLATFGVDVDTIIAQFAANGATNA